MSELLLLLQFSVPVGLAALGETLTQRAGLINIGLEGTMLIGAYAGMFATHLTGNPWLGVAVGGLAGLLLSLVFGLFTITLLVDQVVTGAAISLLALGVTGAHFRSQFGESGVLLSVPKIPNWQGVDWVLLATLLAVPVVYVLLFKTPWGLGVRACGEEPAAADALGWDVARLRFQTLALGGVLGGIAGAYLSLGIVGSFSENMTGGRGFVAIAMVTFARWNPLFVIGAALLMGYLDSLQYAFQAKGWNLPYQLFIAMPYGVALLVLIAVGKGTAAPAALGVPFRRPK
ncbi:MAG: ABC transporter permease [Fimbriimonadaceae bacterium]|nr:hypothetical protein [Fimbriimonadaceae bacterium]MCC6351667.1 ABC transporter permease [Fimbriimonadaceae bacterium]RIJ98159.1 MAG: ABC transporter permease [Armatimonadota bacterium]